jgi:hypothetical protein
MLWKRGEATWMAYRMARFWVQERLSQRRALAAAKDEAAAPPPDLEPPAELMGN